MFFWNSNLSIRAGVVNISLLDNKIHLSRVSERKIDIGYIPSCYDDDTSGPLKKDKKTTKNNNKNSKYDLRCKICIKCQLARPFHVYFFWEAFYESVNYFFPLNKPSQTNFLKTVPGIWPLRAKKRNSTGAVSKVIKSSVPWHVPD